MQEFDKKYYRIGDVAQILGIPVTTLRFWESQLTILKPKRNDKGTRFYTPADIETIKKIHYLRRHKRKSVPTAMVWTSASKWWTGSKASAPNSRNCNKHSTQCLNKSH